MNDEQTNWTSIDLYFKGFHVKKSYPKAIKLDKLAELIDKAIEAGFEPSWNKETSQGQLDTDADWVKEEGSEVCTIHKVKMIKSKKGNWYHREEGTDRFCMGKGYIAPKQ